MTAFDHAYYERHYLRADTRVAAPEDIAKLGKFICSYLAFLDVEVTSALDLGCGLGWWRHVITEHFPDAEYTGVEISEYVCEEHGFVHGSVVDFESDPADFVICQGVLQYLDDDDAERALHNLAELTDTALYLEALTQRDWDEACSQKETDGAVHLRPVTFYEERLTPHFLKCGGGLFVKRDSAVVLYELERLDLG